MEGVLPVHDALQDRGKGCDADSRPNQDGMFGGEDLSCGSPIRSVHVALTHGTRLKRIHSFIFIYKRFAGPEGAETTRTVCCGGFESILKSCTC